MEIGNRGDRDMVWMQRRGRSVTRLHGMEDWTCVWVGRELVWRKTWDWVRWCVETGVAMIGFRGRGLQGVVMWVLYRMEGCRGWYGDMG